MPHQGMGRPKGDLQWAHSDIKVARRSVAQIKASRLALPLGLVVLLLTIVIFGSQREVSVAPKPSVKPYTIVNTTITRVTLPQTPQK